MERIRYYHTITLRDMDDGEDEDNNENHNMKKKSG